MAKKITYMPTRDEYCAEMRRQGNGDYAALRGDFDKCKPHDWVHTETIRRHTGMTYTEIARECGLKLQTIQDRASPELDAPPERIGSTLARAALDATEHMRGRLVWRPVMAWQPLAYNGDSPCEWGYAPTGEWQSLCQIGPFPQPQGR